MRRRLRQQTRMREALLVDLGALVYELHRHGRREPELLQAKASELTVVDQEVRALTDALGAGEGELALVAAGIAGSCQRCGTLLSTDARYCSGCGAEAAPSLPGSAPAEARGVAAADPPAEPADRDLDPDATGIIGRAEPEPAAPEFGEPADEDPLDGSEPHDEESDERAPWLAEGDDVAQVAAEEPVDEPTAQQPPVAQTSPPPPTTRRRRSGGAVGKVAGLIRRPRDGG